MAVILADLAVKIGVDADKVNTGLDEAEGFFERHAGKIKAAGAALGAGAGIALSTGITKGLEIEQANDKLAAQLGATGPEAGRLGKIAGDLYSGAWGDSLEQVNEALRTVVTNIGGMATASDADLKKITASTLDVATAFDEDVGQTARAVGQLIKTGLAGDATEALDILTAGFQRTGDPADDLLDTVTEYGTKFRDLGLDGQTAMGLISQGLKAGARDTDFIADALKEFSIRAIDGSKTTAEGFRALGLDAEDMAGKIAAGGPKAAGALDLTLDKLRDIEDPVKRDKAAVALFGTKAEDLGDALYALDPSAATTALGEVGGAAEDMGTKLNENAATGIESWKRSTETALADLANAPGTMGQVAQAAAGIGQVLLPIGSDLGGVLMGMFAGTKLLGPVLSGLAPVFKAAATGVRTFSLALFTSPITWIVLGIVAIIAAIVLLIVYWDEVSAAVGEAWDWIVGKLGEAWDWIVGKFNQAVAWLRGIWDGVWKWVEDRIAGAMNTVKSWIATAITFVITTFNRIAALPGKVGAWFAGLARAAIVKGGELLAWVKALPGRVWNFLSGLGSALYNAGRNAINGLWRGLRNMWESVKRWFLGILDWMRGLWPFSPAKHGPLRAHPMDTAGENVIGMLGDGIRSATPALLDQLRGVAEAVEMPGVQVHAPGVARASSMPDARREQRDERRIVVDVRGGADDLARLIRKWIRTEGGGDVQTALGR